MRLPLELSFALGLMLWVGVQPAAAQQPQAGQTVPVGVVTAEKKPVTHGADFVGRIDAVERVEVRARVKGYLEAVNFTEGDRIKTGASLYTIEKGLFQAAVEQAQGALDRAEAALTLATLQRQRAQDLVDKNAGTVVARDQAVAQEQQAQGAVLTAKADLDTAKINLGYTDITSPIDGKIGRTSITKGNVVGPDGTTPLTTIVSQDPMYVSFPVSQRDLLEAAAKGGKKSAKDLAVTIRLADDTVYDQKGRLDFLDVSVSRSTDTVLVRAVIANPKGTLIDGQLVRVTLETVQPEERVVVPQAALIADQQGLYVFVVEDGKAVVRRIKAGPGVGTDQVVESGLTGGELVVVQGLQSLRPGTAVRATPVPTVGRS